MVAPRRVVKVATTESWYMSGMAVLAPSKPQAPATSPGRPAAALVGLTVALVADGNAFLGLAFAFLWLSHVPSGLAPATWQPFAPLGLWVAASLAIVASAVHGALRFVRASADESARGLTSPRSVHRLLSFGALVLGAACAWGSSVAAREIHAPFASLRALTLALFVVHQLITLVPAPRLGRWGFLYPTYLGLVWLLLAGVALAGHALLPELR
jgi:hypothetical protein